VLWLKEDQFLTYMKNVEGLTQADAEEKWKAALRDTSVVKNGSGASTMVPVKGIPRSEAIRGRKASRALKRSTAVSDPSDLDSLSSRLSEHSQGRSLHDPDFGNVGGSLFRAGASVSVAASSGDIFPTLPSTGVSVPAHNMPEFSTDLAATDVPTATDSQVPRRTLGRQRSGGGAPPKRQAKAKAPLAPIVHRRKAAKELLKTTLKQYKQLKQNPVRAVRSLVQRLGPKHATVVETDAVDKLNNYDQMVVDMIAAGSGCDSWTVQNVDDNERKLATAAQALREAFACVNDIKNVIQGSRKTETKNALKDKRTNRQRVMRTTKGYADNMPLNWRNALVELNVVTDPSDAAPSAYEPTLHAVTQDADQQWTKPMLFSTASQVSAAVSFRSLTPSLNAERVNAAARNCFKFHETSGEALSFMRLPARGGQHDSIERLDWVPKDLVELKCLPEALRGHGAPWALCSNQGTMRHCPTQIPYLGEPSVFHVIKGRLFIVSFSVRPLVDVQMELQEGHTYIANLPLKDFSEFMQRRCRHALVAAGDTFWVPGGYHVVMITMDTESSVVLQQPYVCSALLAMLSAQKLKAVQHSVTSFLTRQASSDLWGKVATGHSDWLRSVAAMGEESDDAEILGASRAEPEEAEADDSEEAEEGDLEADAQVPE
jgi:translation initiation factor 1 (eIF-1/SUI1)